MQIIYIQIHIQENIVYTQSYSQNFNQTKPTHQAQTNFLTS